MNGRTIMFVLSGAALAVAVDTFRVKERAAAATATGAVSPSYGAIYLRELHPTNPLLYIGGLLGYLASRLT